MIGRMATIRLRFDRRAGLALRPVGLGNLGFDGYDPADEETGGTSSADGVDLPPSWRTG